MVHAPWGMSIGNVAQVSWEMDDERELDQAVMIRPKSVLCVVRIWVKFLDVGGEAFGADVFSPWVPGRRVFNCYGPLEMMELGSADLVFSFCFVCFALRTATV